MAELLRAEGIHKHYDGVRALAGASVAVEAGEVHALMGENGAGKSTLAKIIAGSVRADRGTIRLNGAPREIASPLDAQRLGIGIIYQELDLFPNLSIAENLAIANLKVERSQWVDGAALARFCAPFLQQVGLNRPPGTPVGELPIGQMQQVAVARALSMDARVILMDEPTSSLGDDAAARLFALVAALKRRGVAVVYVSHKMDEIFRICDRLTVMRDGETVGTRAVAETNPAEVIRMMVGRELREGTRAARPDRGEVLLSVSGLTAGKLSGIGFELHRGEVLGIAGLVGAGRSELGAALFGLDRIRAGSVRLKGAPFRPASPRAAMDAGLGLLPEDRKRQGLMLGMSVRENTTISVLPRFETAGFVRRSEERAATEEVHRSLATRAAGWDARTGSLSGGNQQKVLLARWLLADPDVLFLDDPTRGIDVAAKRDIYDRIESLAAAGKGILFVSSELPELLACCDRILVLNHGRAAGIFDARSTTQEEIMAAAMAALPGTDGAGVRL